MPKILGTVSTSTTCKSPSGGLVAEVSQCNQILNTIRSVKHIHSSYNKQHYDLTQMQGRQKINNLACWVVGYRIWEFGNSQHNCLFSTRASHPIDVGFGNAALV